MGQSQQSSPSLIEVRFQRGLFLPELELWLDPQDARPRAFVSHAHADHFARHQSVLCSDTTAALLGDRFGLAANRQEAVSFHVPVVRDGFRIRLLPAGHIPGSAMIHITRIKDHASLLYTGDFKTRRSRTSESVNFLSADTLILETTFGLPHYEFPNPLEVEASLLRFVHESFEDGATPVLLAYSLGKAQEALALLTEHEIPAVLHPAAVAMTRACRKAGVPGLPEPLEFDGHAPAGHVVIAPPSAVRTNLLKGLACKRTAMLSGWAMQPGARYRYKVDAMIPFSDHADHPGLMECIQRVRPKRILTVHGFAREFATELRALRMDAWSAQGGDQLELPIQRPAKRQAGARPPWHQRVVCPLADFSDLCRLVEETGSRTAKIRFLASYLGGLESDEDLQTAVQWIGNSMAKPRAPGKTATSLNATSLGHVFAAIPGANKQRFREIHQVQKDLTLSTRIFLQELQLRPDRIDLTETASFIADFHRNTHSMDRIRTLAGRLSTLHPAEGETLVKLLTGNLRLGTDAELLSSALAAAFQVTQEEIQNALRITDSPAATALLARHRRLAEAKPANPEIPNPKRSLPAADTGELPFP